MADFHDNPFGGDDFFNDASAGVQSLSKFEDFMQRKQQRGRPQQQRPRRGGVNPRNANGGNNGGGAGNALSPRSEDGMSFVSRQKHNNYADVVLEMKASQRKRQNLSGGGGRGGGAASRQAGGGGRPRQGRQGDRTQQQQHGQQGQQGQQWGFDSDPFGNDGFSPQQQPQRQNYNTVSQQNYGQGGFSQQQQQPQQQPQQRQQQQNYGGGPRSAMGAAQRLTPPRSNNSNHRQQQQQQQQKGPPVTTTRSGRKLYHDPNMKTRSRSTVRRTADRTQQLAVAYRESKRRNDDDCASDVGSAFSIGGDPFVHCLSGSGSISGESFGGGFSRQNSGRSSGGSAARGSLGGSLDAFMGQNSKPDAGGDGGDGGSVASGTGSVAARRRARSRAAAARGGGSSPPPAPGKIHRPGAGPARRQNSGASTGAGAGVGAGGSASSGSARQNMRRRMRDGGAPRTPGGGPTTPGRGGPTTPGHQTPTAPGHRKPATPGRRGPTTPGHQNPTAPGNGRTPRTPGTPSQPGHLKPTTPGRLSPPRQKYHPTGVMPRQPPFPDVNLSSEVIDHEVDQALSELQLSHHLSVDDFGFGRLSSDASGSGSFDSGTAKSGGTGGTGGTGVAGRTGSGEWGTGAAAGEGKFDGSHTVCTRSMTDTDSPGQSQQSKTKAPPTTRRAVDTIHDYRSTADRSAGSAGGARTAAASNVGGGAAIAPVISVEQHSESSSLTDDVSDSWGTGAGGGWNTNMFKDAERMGSTFHKSKKIVRPEEVRPTRGEGEPQPRAEPSSRGEPQQRGQLQPSPMGQPSSKSQPRPQPQPSPRGQPSSKSQPQPQPSPRGQPSSKSMPQPQSQPQPSQRGQPSPRGQHSHPQPALRVQPSPRGQLFPRSQPSPRGQTSHESDSPPKMSPRSRSKSQPPPMRQRAQQKTMLKLRVPEDPSRLRREDEDAAGRPPPTRPRDDNDIPKGHPSARGGESIKDRIARLKGESSSPARITDLELPEFGRKGSSPSASATLRQTGATDGGTRPETGEPARHPESARDEAEAPPTPALSPSMASTARSVRNSPFLNKERGVVDEPAPASPAPGGRGPPTSERTPSPTRGRPQPPSPGRGYQQQGRPPQPPPASPNPFAVKLRRTRPPTAPGAPGGPTTEQPASAPSRGSSPSPRSAGQGAGSLSRGRSGSGGGHSGHDYGGSGGGREEGDAPRNPFLAQVKLRKTGGVGVAPKVALLKGSEDEGQEAVRTMEPANYGPVSAQQQPEQQQQEHEQQHEQQQHEQQQQEQQQQEQQQDPPKKLTWREKQELKRQQEAQEAEARARQQQQQREEAPSKKKPTYREQQDLLKAQRRQDQEEASREDPPAKDVATLIRERIAASRQNGAASNGGGNGNGGGGTNFDALRCNLKKTSADPPAPQGQHRDGLSTAVFKRTVPPTPTKGKDVGSPPGNAPPPSERSDREGAGGAPNNVPTRSEGRAPAEYRHDVEEEEEEEEEEDSDPRAALMAMIGRRAAPPSDLAQSAPPAPPRQAPSVDAAHAARLAAENAEKEARIAQLEAQLAEQAEKALRAEEEASGSGAGSGAARAGGRGDPPSSKRPIAAAPAGRASPTAGPGRDDDDEPSEDASPPPSMHPLAAMLAKRASPAAAERPSDDGRGEPPDGGAPSPSAHPLAAMIAGRASPRGRGGGEGPGPRVAPPATPAGRAAKEGGEGGGRPALKDDPRYEKYFKMLKVGMPLLAVQHAMTRDGLDPALMDGDPHLPAPEPAPEGGGGGVPLKQDPAYAKYFKMLQLGLPMGAVKNAMERDGLDPKVMDGDHNAPAPSSAGERSDSAKKRQRDTHRRTRLHWDTSGIQLNPNSVWARLRDDEELERIEIDEKEFTSLFQAEISKAAAVPSGGAGGASRNVVQVIDPKRANNGGIILARLRMSYDDMAKVVERIDETAMTANQAQGIIEYMPTLAERNSLREYMKASENGGSAAKFERLCECEKFMVAMMTVMQSKRKIRALLFKLQFRGCIHDLAHDVFTIEKACDELSNSARLRKLFGIVLNIGNRLNTAGPGQKRKAGAFTVKSLLKLNQAKAFDNKTTFLHYVVLVVRRNSEELLDFKEDLPTVPKADKIFWDQCVAELEEVETQLENVRKLALHEAGSGSDKTPAYALPGKSKRPAEDDDVDSDDLSVESMSLEEEVALLRSTKVGMFALSAIRKVSQLRERVDAAKDKFVGLLEYFGESRDSKMQPHELFEIIATFVRTFDVARGDVDKIEKEKKRDENKKDKDDAKAAAASRRSGDATEKNEKLKAIQENQTPIKKNSLNTHARPPSNRPMPRASSMQPNLGAVLSDLKRAASAKWNATGTHTPLPNGGNNPKVPPKRYPTDKTAPAAEGDESEEPPPDGHSAPRRGRRQTPVPSVPSKENSAALARARARAEEEEAKARERAEARARAEAESYEAARRAEAESEEAARTATKTATEEKERLAEAESEETARKAAREEERLAEEAAGRRESESLEAARSAESLEAARLAKLRTEEEEAAAAAVEAAEMEIRRQRQFDDNTQAVAAPRSHETETDPRDRGSEISSSAASPEDENPFPDRSRPATATATRRDMMASRRRNRHHRAAYASSPRKEARAPSTPSETSAPARPMAPAAPREMKQKAGTAAVASPRPVGRATSPRPASSANASARAAARNRYARHKRMLQQKQGS